MSTASGSSSRHKLWTYCLLCCWLGCELCSGGLKGCIFLCSLSWTFWCILWCCMGKLSLLNGGAEQSNILAILHVLNVHMAADLGINELILLCWLFWYLAHFSMTNVLLWMVGLNGWMVGLNSNNLAVLHVLNIHMELILVPMNSWLVMLIILIPGSFLYDQWFFFEWWGWMVGHEWLNGRSEWLNVLAILHVLNIHMELILVPMNSAHHADCFDTWLVFLWLMVLAQYSASHQKLPCLGWPFWLQVKFDWPGW